MTTTNDSLLSTYVQNILVAYDQATEDERMIGSNWYVSAHNICKAYAKAFNTTVEKAVCVMAVLSPRNSWVNNQRDAFAIMQAIDAYGVFPASLTYFAYETNVNKAVAILKHPTNNVDELMNLVGKGNKTRSFAYCMLYPNTSLDVCIDTHAYSVCCGTRKTANDADKAVFSKHKGYSLCAQAFVVAAKRRCIKPHVMQATTWTVWRRLCNLK